MANQKISELTAIATIDNATDVLPIVDTSATTTKKITLTQVKTSLALNNVDNTSDVNKPVSSATQTALDAKVTGNSAITGAAKTKITYDAKGLVTAGADATTADIASSLDKRYVTDAQLVVVGNTSGTNTGDNATNSQYSGLAASKQDTLVSATNIKTINSTSLLGSGDVAVQATLVSGTNIKTINSTSLLGSGDIVLSASPSGVSGSIQFSNGSAFASDAANFFWDDTNNRLGIGTATPGATLDVHNSGAIVAQFNKTVSGNSYIQQLMAGAAKWKHGFTTATGAFDIIDDVNALTRLSLLNTGQLKLNAYTSTSAFTGTTAGFLAFDTSGNILSVTSPATSPSGVSGAIQFSNGSAFASDAANLFFDDTNNRLGVGTNAPTATGHFKGSGATSATTSFLVQNSAGTDLLKISDNGAGFHTVPSGTLTAFQFISDQARLQINPYDSGTYGTIIRSFNAAGSAAQKLSFWASGFNFETAGGLQVSNNSTGAVASAMLQADSTTKGFLPPRMTTTQRNAIASPAEGLMIYNTTTAKLNVFTTAWEAITSL